MYKLINSKLFSNFLKLIPKNLNLKFRNYFFSIYYFFSASNSLDLEDIKINKLLINNFDSIDYKNIQIFDIGSGHPKIHSNSYFFYKKGSHTVAIDTNKKLINLFQKIRKKDTALFGAVSDDKSNEIFFYEMSPWELSTINEEWYKYTLETTNSSLVSKHKVPILNISKVLEKHYNFQKQLHILMIDIEGESLNLVNAINFQKFQFDILLVEKDLKNTPPSLVEFYELIDEDKFNYFFIKKFDT